MSLDKRYMRGMVGFKARERSLLWGSEGGGASILFEFGTTIALTSGGILNG
jgi:hypothetical protein